MNPSTVTSTTSATSAGAQPCNGLQVAPRRSHHTCSADQCQQGRAPCPCPAACELPEPNHLRDEPLTTAEAALMWAAVLLATLMAAGVIFASAA